MHTLQPCLHAEGVAKKLSTFALCAAVGVGLILAQQARADFVGNYAVNNFTLTNIDYFNLDADTNGSVMSLDGGLSVILTGGDSGTGLLSGGETDFLINAAASGLVQFNWSYASLDTPGYDWAGYQLGNTFTQLADTNGESGVLQTFSVTAGESFGFVVVTADNNGGPGILTISNFSAPAADPVPEPRTLAIPCILAAGILAAQQRRRRANLSAGGAA
jgi:hypothetical protein